MYFGFLSFLWWCCACSIDSLTKTAAMTGTVCQNVRVLESESSKQIHFWVDRTDTKAVLWQGRAVKFSVQQISFYMMQQKYKSRVHTAGHDIMTSTQSSSTQQWNILSSSFWLSIPLFTLISLNLLCQSSWLMADKCILDVKLPFNIFTSLSFTYRCFSMPVFWGSKKKKKERESERAEWKKEKQWEKMLIYGSKESIILMLDVAQCESSLRWSKTAQTNVRKRGRTGKKKQRDNRWSDQWGGELWQVCTQRLVKRSHAFHHAGYMPSLADTKHACFRCLGHLNYPGKADKLHCLLNQYVNWTCQSELYMLMQ